MRIDPDMRKNIFPDQEIISYTEMCAAEGQSLQHGMNFRNNESVFLMSMRKGAPYDDHFDRERNVLIYEGHDEAKRRGVRNPKKIDQPLRLPSGKPTPNGKFYEAAQEFKNHKRDQALRIRVYEKLKTGIWVFNGTFSLENAWVQESGNRKVIKFELFLETSSEPLTNDRQVELSNLRFIPSQVKQEVYKRDKGKCVICGSQDNLHFDHDLAYKRGGTSLIAENIRLLCARHNLQKGAKIE
jgi:hypothetical protein